MVELADKTKEPVLVSAVIRVDITKLLANLYSLLRLLQLLPHLLKVMRSLLLRKNKKLLMPLPSLRKLPPRRRRLSPLLRPHLLKKKPRNENKNLTIPLMQ